MKLITGIVVVALCSPLAAQQLPSPAGFARILLPISMPGPTPGAFGSTWQTSVAITITGAQPLALYGFFEPFCGIPEGCGVEPEPPGITFYPIVFPPITGTSGTFLWVERGRQSDIHVGLFLHNITSNDQNAGTELPVVPEASFLTTPAELGGIALLSGFRSNLRIYDLDQSVPHAARVRLYVDSGSQVPGPPDAPSLPDRLVYDQTIAFSVVSNFIPPGPGMIYIDLSGLPELVGVDHVHAVVTPADGDAFPLWAMASVTDNASQLVTTVSPR